ncbi:hypothetical protein D9619_000034 [Psilocybe cf. subviscida]|uniref:DUF6534 domain-containing protein n=1 Tax=Psilocybe cf. subviscida TaxID=2480587 RepID=A0A8H5F2A0_9AGAR|nr:hypothetical protein D9619_000034 [Psilocybe cf. subviscida]
MVRRYFIMSRHYFISAVIIALMILSLERNMYLGISSAIGNLPVDKRPANSRPVLLALCSSTAADLTTMIAMFWKLKVTNTYSRITHNLIYRMSAVVIITGTATCMVALAIMISFITYPVSSLSTCFGYFIGRVYSLTMLFTLVYRDMIKNDQWIQIDEVEEAARGASEGPTMHRSVSDGLPVSSTPVSDMVFETTSNLSHRGTHQDQVVIEHQEKSDSRNTIGETNVETIA